MGTTKIEWADEVWNPVWGCRNTCPYCYARKIAHRFGKTYEEREFNPTWMEANFNRKFRKDTKRVFVNSMSDVAYWKPEWWIRVMDRIKLMPQYDFIFLTKGVYETYPYEFYPNCVFGWTMDNPNRIGSVLSPTRTLLNVEPMLQPLTDKYAISNAASYDWVIIGAETSNRIGKPIPEFGWYEPIINRAIDRNIPYFIKPSLKDITPPELYRQEFPKRREQ